MGITQHTTGTDNVLALANLAMATGNVGKPSSGVNPLRGQNNVQGALNFTIPFTQWSESLGQIKAGLFAERTEREFDKRGFFYRFSNQYRARRDIAAACSRPRLFRSTKSGSATQAPFAST